MHVQRRGEQPERGEHQEGRYCGANHVSADGSLAREVVAHPVAHLVGELVAERIADVLERSWPFHRKSFLSSSAPAANAAVLTRVSTSCSSSSSSSPTPSRSITAGGILRARRRKWVPALVSSTSVARSSTALRVRVIRPSASNRLSIGDNVAESSCSAAAIALTDSGRSTFDLWWSHSASITRYCGWVSPSGSSNGRYTASTARLVTASAKHTCRSRARGSMSSATSVMTPPYAVR